MTLVQLFRESVAKRADLPSWVANHPISDSDLRRHAFDESYLDFLDGQIALSPRGPEWTQRLIERKESLKDFCNMELIGCSLGHDPDGITIEIDPIERKVIHWETYEDIKTQF
jgi:hypothetical protein